MAASLVLLPLLPLLWQLTLVTDKFFWLHDDLFRKRVASGPYDVPTAIDVLGYGAFPRLPKYAGGTAADYGTTNECSCFASACSPRGLAACREALVSCMRQVTAGVRLTPPPPCLAGHVIGRCSWGRSRPGGTSRSRRSVPGGRGGEGGGGEGVCGEDESTPQVARTFPNQMQPLSY